MAKNHQNDNVTVNNIVLYAQHVYHITVTAITNMFTLYYMRLYPPRYRNALRVKLLATANKAK